MGPRGEHTRNDKYERILKGAGVIFARYGYFNSKVSQIAREANVADGTIYLYFKNKEDILLRFFEERMDEIISLLQERLKPIDNVFARIREYVYWHFSIVREDPELIEVITVELRQSAKFMKEYTNDKFKEYLDIISYVIREGKDQGLIREDVHPGVIKRGLFGMIDELLLLSVLRSRVADSDVEEMARQVTELLVRGIAKDPEEALRQCFGTTDMTRNSSQTL